ncbi:MAG TPA: choice-of-anchor Q domain-containing protein [Rudaea sp.]|nr:choice-of-anchor Q domain-containing protein [Rudaea sp.]
MTAPFRSGGLSALRLRPLAAVLAATIAAAATGHGAAQVANVDQTATIVVVQNCNDSGPGSLRAAYANAVDNETIDLTQLVCSRITLGSALVDPIAAANVALLGPGKDLLAIDGDALYQVLVHRGNGGLHVDHLTITNGHYAGSRGGCVYSAGGFEATGTLVSSCVLDSSEYFSYGGAIYAKDVVSLFDSTVSDSSAKGTATVGGRGGGIYSSGIVMGRSTISGNFAAKGGGILSKGLVYIRDSTLSGNEAGTYGGALIAQNASSHIIRNSTVSGNNAGNNGGAIYANYIGIYNSTIVHNATGSTFSGGAGLFIGASTIQSSIIARNTSGSGLIADDVVAYGVITGSNNLIMASIGPVSAVGRITIDPNLGPLQENGGPTRTHALLPGSPAIGRGNNVLGLGADQRGAPFGRVDGSGADIGAFEFADTVFGDGLEPPE